MRKKTHTNKYLVNCIPYIWIKNGDVSKNKILVHSMSLKIIAVSHIIYRQNLVPMFLRCQKDFTAHTIIKVTRMHSSRMHTVRCSGRLSCHAAPHCHAYPPATHAPTMHPPPCMPPPCSPPATHAPPPPCMATLPCMLPLAMHPPHACPPVDRILDTRLWKHYLPATTVADGNNRLAPPPPPSDQLGNPRSATGNRIWSVWNQTLMKNYCFLENSTFYWTATGRQQLQYF